MRQEDDPVVIRTNMPVLVTGASGFIGSHVVRELLSRGYSVKAMVRDSSLSEIFQENDRLEIVQANLFDIDSLKLAIQNCDDVIHCAASLYIGAKDVKKEVVDPSVIGTKNLCEVMGNVRRIVHTSSVAAIRSSTFENGKVFTKRDWCEDADEFNNPYGFAKAEAEKEIRKWASERDVRLVTIHPSIVFGPILHRRHTDGSMAYLKHFCGKIPFVLDIHVNFVDVRDVAVAHVNALECGEDKGRYIIHKKGLWMNEIGQILNLNLKGKFATKRLPRFLAYVLAFFHPKLSIKRLKGNLERYVSYDVEDSFEVLDLPNYDFERTIVDSVNSIRA